MHIGPIDLNEKVFIVAEIGNNHEGSLDRALKMVALAAESGVDAVKFQTFIPRHYVSICDEERLNRLQGFLLSHRALHKLARQAEALGLVFFSTPFDIQSALFLDSLQSVFKIASGDNNFFHLIETVAGFGKPTMISTGLADLPLLDRLYSIWLKRGAVNNLAFLHCVGSYPVPIEQANLAAISQLKLHFPDITIGYSDHTLGIEAAAYAVAAGARIIEKHFTMDKHYSDFRDHFLSADPDEMRRLVEAIRNVEMMMGSGEKTPQPCEEVLQTAGRRSVAAGRDLPEGSLLDFSDLTWVRPGIGIPPGHEDLVLGRRTVRALRQGEIIRLEDLV